MTDDCAVCVVDGRRRGELRKLKKTSKLVGRHYLILLTYPMAQAAGRSEEGTWFD